jgi:hypothetical protein
MLEFVSFEDVTSEDVSYNPWDAIDAALDNDNTEDED